MDITALRLQNQLLSSKKFNSPQEIVSYFGAMQSQDYYGAKWGVALRSKNLTDQDIETAFNNGEILRTHVMRPTWHFVAPQDIRWLLQLTSPRVQAFNGYYYRKSGLHKDIFIKSSRIIAKALQGGNQFTRKELNAILKQYKIPTDRLGLSYTIMQAELEGIICSGPRRGLQFTYMLLDERVDKFKDLHRDEALVELTKRFFQSHGPAQFKDFVWWSGLSFIDCKKGVEMLGKKIQKEVVKDKIYWFFQSKRSIQKESPDGFLLPGFDEYFIAYNDRSDILQDAYKKHLNLGGGMLRGAVVVAGKMVGGWQRTITKKSVHVTLHLLEKISQEQHKAIITHAHAYAKFLTLPLTISS